MEWFPWSIMAQLSDGTKLKRTRGRGKGCGVCKNEKLYSWIQIYA